MPIESDTLFPTELLPGSVDSREELEQAFAQYPDYSEEYLAIALAKLRIREWYEEQWSFVRDYLDKDFKDRLKIKGEWLGRAWEFHLAAVFKKYDLPLKKKGWSSGPDFCIEMPDGKKIWIEAIACTQGTVDAVEPMPEMVSGVIYDFSGDIEQINRPRALRVTAAIRNKLEKYRGYATKLISPNDCIIIAINGEAIQHHADPESLFRYAVFGQGPDMLIHRRVGKIEGGYYKPVPTIVKNAQAGQKEVQTHCMVMEEFANISAVIYSGTSAWNNMLNGREIGDDFLFGYHSNPLMPVPSGLFKFGTDIRKNPLTGVIRTERQR
jgi:hypothetical protein